jgi:hypothetical protein
MMHDVARARENPLLLVVEALGKGRHGKADYQSYKYFTVRVYSKASGIDRGAML